MYASNEPPCIQSHEAHQEDNHTLTTWNPEPHSLAPCTMTWTLVRSASSSTVPSIAECSCVHWTLPCKSFEVSLYKVNTSEFSHTGVWKSISNGAGLGQDDETKFFLIDNDDYSQELARLDLPT
jgi:hypothetical protein